MVIERQVWSFAEQTISLLPQALLLTKPPISYNSFSSSWFFPHLTLFLKIYTLYEKILSCLTPPTYNLDFLIFLLTFNVLHCYIITFDTLIHCLHKHFSVASSLFAPKAPTHHNRAQMAKNLHSPNLNNKINSLISLLFLIGLIQIWATIFTRFRVEGAFGMMRFWHFVSARLIHRSMLLWLQTKEEENGHYFLGDWTGWRGAEVEYYGHGNGIWSPLYVVSPPSNRILSLYRQPWAVGQYLITGTYISHFGSFSVLVYLWIIGYG